MATSNDVAMAAQDFDPAPALDRMRLNDADEENQRPRTAGTGKHPFDESMDSDTKAENYQVRRQISQGNLPPLPPTDTESVYEGEHSLSPKSDGHMDTVDESQMRRHLDNLESSFMSAPSYVERPVGADDTFLFDAVKGAPPKVEDGARGRSPEKLEEQLEKVDEESSMMRSEVSPCAGRDTGRMSREESLRHEGDREPVVNYGADSTSELETMSSSPTVAAAARTISRVISMASMGFDVAGHEVGTYNRDHHSDSDRDNDKPDTESERGCIDTPRAESQLDGGEDSDGRSTIGRKNSNESLNAKDAGRTPGAALRKRAASIPKFLRSRNNSERSSISVASMNLRPDEADESFSADYAMLSGGAAPQNSSSTQRWPSQALSRTISLGSIASGINDDETEPTTANGALDPLEEESTQIKEEEATNDFATPKASRSLAPPTDTVIARHVRNVQVPDSVAKEYKSRPGVSPARYSASVVGANERQGKNMTLKEQSSTIERLSKENFDLKLKVMFLSDRLDKLSEEGVKEMVSENVELKTVLANLQRDNKALRRKVKELEHESKEGKGEPARPDTARSGTSSDDPQHAWFEQENQERGEELHFLRERIEEYEFEFEKMRQENLARENEKRKLAEIVMTMGKKRGEDMDAREEMDVWKDLLEQETARREQSDDDNRRLRDEIFRLKSKGVLQQPDARPQSVAGSLPAMNHTTNIYNITKKRQMSPSRPMSGFSEQPAGSVFSGATTLVEELRNESERLRHENAELRREVGAQTSMLTSRNREKERLYQEIEDLKMGHRRGSITGDSILDRSASRAGQRPHSRGSAMTRLTSAPEVDVEELENKNAELRDQLNALKLENQELRKELDSCMEDFEIAVNGKREAEARIAELQGELQATETDLVAMQTERDEALRGQEEVETEFESLRKEAQDEIDALEHEAEQHNATIQTFRTELANTTENFNALQAEMREMSEAVVRLEDDHEIKSRRITELEKEVEQNNGELDEMEKAVAEARDKIQRLTVQLESGQGEIKFLREEQDGDKIKIGDLETLVRNVEAATRDEKERVRELEERLMSERHQREVVAGQERQEIQRYINELNKEASGAKDEARRLRKALSSKEVESTEWKGRLIELENNIRQALGDLNGTRSSFVKGITDLQRQLDSTTRELLSTRDAILEKDRIIKQRDNLLESSGLEVRKIADLLEKERAAHRSTKHQHEASLTQQHHTTRTISQQEARVLQLENALSHDRKKMAHVESAFKDAMLERNQLLIALWNRLSALCGSDWAHGNSLINGRALPSLEAISGQMFGGFAKNLVAAVKMVESIVMGFRGKIRDVERRLWKEMREIESTIEQRTQKLERLEAAVKSQALSNSTLETKGEIGRLQNLNRLLRAELAANRGSTPGRKGSNASGGNRETNLDELGSPSPTVPMGPRSSVHKLSGLSRGYSEGAIPMPPLERTQSSLDRNASNSTQQSYSTQQTQDHTKPPFSDSQSTTGTESDPRRSTYRPINAQLPQPGAVRRGLDESMPPGLSAEEAWEWRMQEMERRLKEEREGRRLDRRNAQRRLEEESKRVRMGEEERRRERGREKRSGNGEGSHGGSAVGY